MSGLRRALADLRTAVTMPRVQIVLSRGEPDDDEVLHRFRRPHPRLNLVGAGTVIAYTRLDYVGDIAGMGRVMGHGDHLDNGAMSLLMAGIVEYVKAARLGARYLLYDTFFGAPEGLRAFKLNVGLRPHFVRWRREA
jgi:hypothetical protein